MLSLTVNRSIAFGSFPRHPSTLNQGKRHSESRWGTGGLLRRRDGAGGRFLSSGVCVAHPVTSVRIKAAGRIRLKARDEIEVFPVLIIGGAFDEVCASGFVSLGLPGGFQVGLLGGDTGIEFVGAALRFSVVVTEPIGGDGDQ